MEEDRLEKEKAGEKSKNKPEEDMETAEEAAKLQGDFRTGKRLNMRKITPHTVSQFKKDKIWLRRVKPNKREFHILVVLDNFPSMSDAPEETNKPVEKEEVEMEISEDEA